MPNPSKGTVKNGTANTTTNAITGFTSTATLGVLQIAVWSASAATGVDATAPTTAAAGVGTFTKVITTSQNSNNTLDIWEATFTQQITSASFSITAPPSATVYGCSILEIQNGAKHSAATQSSTGSGTTWNQNVTTSGNNELVVGWIFTNDGPSGSTTAITLTKDATIAYSGAVPYNILSCGVNAAVTATGGTTVNAGWTLGASTTTGITVGISVPGAQMATPTNLICVTGQNNQVALRWDAVTGATGYNVKRSTTNGSGYVTLGAGSNVATNSFVDSTAVNGTHYYYVVTALGASPESTNSNQADATPGGGAVPSQPTGLTATINVSGQINLSWTGSMTTYGTSGGGGGSLADSFTLYESSTSGAESSYVTGISTNSYSDTGLQNGIRRYYKVVAVNTYGSSIQSVEVWGVPWNAVRRREGLQWF